MSSSEKAHASVPEESSTLPRSTFVGIPGDILVLATIVIVVSVLRLPFIFWPQEMNPDESQMLSQAMKFLVDPVPWRGVDGTSGGPLNSYLISFLLLWGLKPGYILVHILANILVCLQLSVAYRTLLRISSNAGAIWGVLPVMLCFGFTSDLNYLHYSSELLPALLLAVGFHLFVVTVQGWREGRSSLLSMQLVLCGLALGSAPWCKLQALPIAGILMVALSAHILLSQGRDMHVRSHLARFWLGVLLPSGLILAIVMEGGVLRDFWNSYILGNMAYAGLFKWPKFIYFAKVNLWLPEMRPLTVTILLAVLTLFLFKWKQRVPEFSSEEAWVSGTGACYFVAALFVVSRPTLQFPHYSIFLLHPMTYLAVLLASRTFPLLTAGWEVRARTVMNVLAVSATVIIAAHMGVRIKELRELPHPQPNATERIAVEIQEIELDRPIKSLAIWGWEPGVYVLTGIPPATRDAVGHFVISLGLSRPYFRKRFVGDLRRENPDLFVDAVAKGAYMWFWSENNGYESDAELKSFIDEHYILVKELPLKPGAKPVRFFQRR